MLLNKSKSKQLYVDNNKTQLSITQPLSFQLKENEKLVKLSDKLAYYKVDHKIQINYKTDNLINQNNIFLFNKISNNQKTINRRTWTEFQNSQIDNNLKKINEKQIIFNKNKKITQLINKNNEKHKFNLIINSFFFFI